MATETTTPTTSPPGRFAREPGDEARDDRPVADLVRDLTAQAQTLVRQELELARVELAAKGKQAGIGAGMLGGGAVAALYGGGALVAAAIIALATLIPDALAALAVGVVLLAVAGVLALLGKNRAKRAVPPAPKRAIASSKQDAEAVKHAVQEGRS